MLLLGWEMLTGSVWRHWHRDRRCGICQSSYGIRRTAVVHTVGCVMARRLSGEAVLPLACGGSGQTSHRAQSQALLRSSSRGGATTERGHEDIDTYFRCLAELHKRRLRYEGILASQAFPLMEQVGPRAMLQYGHADPGALAVLLTWRKWIYDIDNRAAQETGYVFEPALVGALGGADVSASASPVKRRGDASRGRQVDCLLETAEGRWAYEFKIRVTIAASGQGRWAEELSFPGEARAAGYVPVLVVFDATENEKLGQLSQAYRAAQGETYIGQDAWQHIEQRSGPTMACSSRSTCVSR